MTYKPAAQQTGPVTALDKADEGITRCDCGCKYWENDRCIDCGTPVTSIADHQIPRGN